MGANDSKDPKSSSNPK